MDTLTHALSGALLARAMPAPAGAVARRVAAGFFACAAPDLDFVASFAGPVEYLLNHRGVTHSLLLMPAWAMGVAWLLAKVLREAGGWRALYAVCLAAIALHIAGALYHTFVRKDGLLRRMWFGRREPGRAQLAGVKKPISGASS